MEALVNDWKKRDWESGQANKIQRAESLYCHRVCVSGKQGERNNLCLLLSPSFCPFFFSFIRFLSNFHFPPLLEAKKPNSIINLEPLSAIWPWHCFSCHLSNTKAHKLAEQGCRLTGRLLYSFAWSDGLTSSSGTDMDSFTWTRTLEEDKESWSRRVSNCLIR